MELNKSVSVKKSDHAPATTRDEQYYSSPGLQSQSGTYNCNFCKGGFSNAQALGGHMNLHRKDKAKLEQSRPITESRLQQILENTKTTTFPTYTTSTKSTDECFMQEPRQLPLFKKTTVIVDDQKPFQEELSSSFRHGAELELDLELRLGHESTSDSSPPAKGTKEFL